MSDVRLSIENESDVEQKLIFPFLTSPSPLGLGYAKSSIRTKPDLRQYRIDKGGSEKLYFPDYLVLQKGLPVFLIEAKSPSGSISEGYREARLYATELNSSLGPKVNPLQRIASTDGENWLFGFWDSEPDIAIPTSNFEISNVDFARVVELFSSDVTLADIQKIIDGIRPNNFFIPLKYLGGQSVRNEEIAPNNFGSIFSNEFRHIFNPRSRHERANIVRSAYVPSRRRERYVEPIDKIIRAAVSPSISDSNTIENTENPTEVINCLKSQAHLEQQIILLIGGVGAGKSTFVDYLREVKLPNDLKNSTIWVSFNLNVAPVSADEIYKWLRSQLVEQLRSEFPRHNFEQIDELLKLYGPQVQSFKMGRGKIIENNKDEYNKQLYSLIEKLQSDKHETAKSFVRYLCQERAKRLVVVFDNCDKRVRSEQLLMFQAAQWFQMEFSSVVILPIRDVTYDHHRNEPPLDTAIKDMVFRIEAPMFQTVLKKRILLTLKEIRKNDSLEHSSYELPNGFRVDLPANDIAYYLVSMLRSLFEHDRFIRRMIVGLAGANIRKAMEIFIEICTSGHIGEDQIFKIKMSKGNYYLPFHVIARALLRTNRRFYSGDQSYIKNLFYCNTKDSFPTFTIRLSILKWLKKSYSRRGPTQLKGYHQVISIKNDLVLLGFSEDAINRELSYLLEKNCIIAEHLGTESIADDDLVIISPCGFAHLELLRNTSYLSAVSEETPYLNEDRAKRIAERISDYKSQNDYVTVLKNASTLVEHLKEEGDLGITLQCNYLKNNNLLELVDTTESQEAVESQIEKMSEGNPWFELDKNLEVGDTLKGEIDSITKHGIFVVTDYNVTGLVPASFLHQDYRNDQTLYTGLEIEVEVRRIDCARQRLTLALLE